MESLEFDPATTALIVVDMQNDFCHAEGYYARIGRNIGPLAAPTAVIGRLMEDARGSGAAIAFTRLVYDDSAGSMEDRHKLKPKRWSAHGKRLVPGTWGAEVIDELSPRAGEIVVDKFGYSAFEGTTLERDLRARGVETILLTGVVTYACVLATAFSAFDKGFDVLMVSDAVGSWFAHLGDSTCEVVDLLMGQAAPYDRIKLRESQPA